MNLDMNTLMSMASLMGAGNGAAGGERQSVNPDMMSMFMNMMSGGRQNPSARYSDSAEQKSQGNTDNLNADGKIRSGYSAASNFARENGLGPEADFPKNEKHAPQNQPPQDGLASMLPMLMNLFQKPAVKTASAPSDAQGDNRADNAKPYKEKPKTPGKNPQFFYDKIKRAPQKKVTGLSAVNFAGFELVDSLKKLKAALSE